MDPLLTRSEVAAILKKKESWLRWSEQNRIIPFIKAGQQIRYARSDVVAWIASRRVVASTTRKRASGRRRIR